jgi:mannose-1-phosphate guanylyltransferase
MAVFPSDHAVLDIQRFRRAVVRAFETAEREACLVTFGILPRNAETGYGYIELGDPLRTTAPRVHWAAGFHEKPHAAGARAYVDSGRYRWNSGMFVWRVDVIRAAFARHAPAIARAAARAVSDRGAAARMPYRRLPVQSVDVAILERADRVAVVDGNFGWSDVGGWAAMPEIWGTDAANNAVRGTGVLIECRDTVVLSPHRLVAAVGMDDVIIIDSPDAVLVCRKSRAQDVRRVVDTLARRGQRRWL